MIIRRGVCLVVLLSFTACSASPKDKVVSWLSADERRVIVYFADSRPRPDFQVHESNAAEGAGKGALAGAGGAIGGGLQSGDPYGLLLGVILMPIFAVVGGVAGAITAESEVSYRDLNEIEGASALFEAADREVDLLTLLKRKIGDMSEAETGHVLVLGEVGDPSADANSAVLTIGFREYSLVGELGKDPSVWLLISGDMSVGIGNGEARYYCSWSYDGWSRKLSAWSADGAMLFREEIEKATDNISQTIARDLRSGGQTCSDAYYWAAPA